MNKVELAGALRQLREAAGLSQTALAAAMGIAGPTVSRIESGQREPDMETISDWARACGRDFKIEFPERPAGADDLFSLRNQLGFLQDRWLFHLDRIARLTANEATKGDWERAIRSEERLAERSLGLAADLRELRARYPNLPPPGLLEEILIAYASILEGLKSRREQLNRSELPEHLVERFEDSNRRNGDVAAMLVRRLAAVGLARPSDGAISRALSVYLPELSASFIETDKLLTTRERLVSAILSAAPDLVVPAFQVPPLPNLSRSPHDMESLQALIRRAEPDEGEHFIWARQDGTVQLSPCAGDDPLALTKQPNPLRFWFPVPATEVGPAAAGDAVRVESLHRKLVQAWHSGTQGGPADGADARVRLATGFVDLDRVLGGGLLPGAFYVLAAAPQHGKTALALNLAANRAAQGTLSLFFTTESNRRILEHRLGEMGKAVLGTDGVLVTDPPVLPDRMLSPLAKHIAELARAQGTRLGLVVIDRIQHLRLTLEKRHRTTLDEYRELGEQLRNLAATLDVPVLAVVGLDRRCEGRENKRPVLSDLGNMEPLSEFAEGVLFLYRDEVYSGEESPQSGIAEVIVASNRSGPTRTLRLGWLAAQQRFQNLAGPPDESF